MDLTCEKKKILRKMKASELCYFSITQKFNPEISEDLSHISSHEDFGIALSESLRIFEVSSSPNFSLIPLNFPIEISSISLNTSAALLLSSSSQVYSLGTDPYEYGFLGTQTYSSKLPTLLSDLSNITQVSMGKTHAGALTDRGHLYMWGQCENSNNTHTPSLYSFEMFTIYKFDCGNNYTVVLTPGGYIYIIGRLGYTHDLGQIDNTGVVCPSDLEKMCTVETKAGNCFVACLMENGDVYAFDGCMDLVKLPVLCSQKIEKIEVVGGKVLGICEEKYVIEWKMMEDFGENCRVGSFVGNGKRCKGKIEVVGWVGEEFVMKSLRECGLDEGVDTILPYKRTEYGQKLIDRARKNVRTSGSKLDFLMASVENSPIYQDFGKVNEKACNKFTYAVNLVIQKAFSDLVVYCNSLRLTKKYKIGGLPLLVFSTFQRELVKKRFRGLSALRLNVEKAKFAEYIKEIAIGNLSGILSRKIMRKALGEIQEFIVAKTIDTAISNLENAERRSLSVSLCYLNDNRKICNFIGALENISNKIRVEILAFLRKLFEKEKKMKKLTKNLKIHLKTVVLQGFFKLSSNSQFFSNLHIVQNFTVNSELKVLKISIKQAQSRHLQSVFRIIKSIFQCIPLKTLIQKRLKEFFSRLAPSQLLKKVLNFHKMLIKSTLRVKFASYKHMLESIYKISNKEIQFLSPIKPIDDEILEEKSGNSHTFINTLTSDVPSNPKSHKSSFSSDILEFHKYLLWWKEFKSKGSKKNSIQNGTEKPPWRPSGTSLIRKNQDFTYKRRKEYSESIRSNKSSISSEESFCKKIGWDRWEYIKKIRSKKCKDLSKMVGFRLVFRVFLRNYEKTWKILKKFAENNNSKALKKLVSQSWKTGVYNIGLLKVSTVMRKKILKFAWIWLNNY